MLITKIVGLTATVSTDKKVKIALLLLEIAIIAIAYKNTKKNYEEKTKKDDLLLKNQKIK